jgi:hypothetical protein
MDYVYRIAISCIAVILFYVFVSNNIFDLRNRLIGQFWSVLTAHESHEQESINVFEALSLDNGIGRSFILEFVRINVKSFPTFIFTPHPINYGVKFSRGLNNGMWNIYTTFDNLLIVAGSFINYIIVFPLMFKYIHKLKQVRIEYTLTVLFMILVYSVFQLGITDVRIKYTFLIFLLFGLKHANLQCIEIKSDAKYFAFAVVLFLTISLGKQ